MAHKSVFAGASLHIPDPDAGVQTAGHDVGPVKLEIRGVSELIITALDKDKSCVH